VNPSHRRRFIIKQPRDIVDRWIVTGDSAGAPLVSLVWRAESIFHPRALFDEVTAGQLNSMRLDTHSREDAGPMTIEGEAIFADDDDIGAWISWASNINTPERKSTISDPAIFSATAQIAFPIFLLTGVVMAAVQFVGAINLPVEVLYAPLAVTCFSFAGAFSGVFRTNKKNFEAHVAKNAAAAITWDQARAKQRQLTSPPATS
jgi:hypothetical protein